MAIFEESFEQSYLDDTIPLCCKFINSRTTDGHTEYVIRVQRGIDDADNWMIIKRYKEFVILDKELQASAYGIYIPPKKYFGNLNRQFIIRRQASLNNYMNEILKNLILSSSVPVKKFLDPSNYSMSMEECALQRASMALRGNGDFHDVKMLLNIGWRPRKLYCTVKRRNYSNEFMLSWSEYGPDRFLDYKQLKSTLKFVSQLSHPYIAPMIISNGYTYGALVVRYSYNRGSLRDIIYNNSPYNTFLKKCQYSKDKCFLDESAIKIYSVQILLALKYLQDKSIPYGNLHSGNVLIEENRAMLSDIENSIFGLPCLYKSYFRENRRIYTLEDVDIYSFGQVLYEMVFAERLELPTYNCIPVNCNDAFCSILNMILSSRSAKEKLPTVSYLLAHRTFSSSMLSKKLEAKCKISSNCKQLLKNTKKHIEENLHEQQNKLWKYRRIKQVEDVIREDENYYDGDAREMMNNKNDKVRKANSEMSLGTTSTDFYESSTSITPTDSLRQTLSSISSPQKMAHSMQSPHLAVESTAENSERSALLNSITSFQKSNLKKV